MVQEADIHRQESGDQPGKPTGWKRGCLTILIPVLAFYLLYTLLLFAPSIVNRVKWQMRGSDNYKYIFSKHGLLPPEMQSGVAVTVKDGEIEHACYTVNRIRSVEILSP